MNTNIYKKNNTICIFFQGRKITFLKILRKKVGREYSRRYLYYNDISSLES